MLRHDRTMSPPESISGVAAARAGSLSPDASVQTERWVLLAAVVASSMAFIDSTALNVALPVLQADLGASGAQLLWILNAYALPVAALLLLGGALGDCFGRKRIYLTGIGIFSAASLACGLAPARLAQASYLAASLSTAAGYF